jgi:hypothetical protein
MDDRTYRRMLFSCQCGHVARSASAEAYHRHNFPLLCRKPKPKRPGVKNEVASEKAR